MKTACAIVLASVSLGTTGILAELSLVYGIVSEAQISLGLLISSETALLSLLSVRKGASRVQKKDALFFLAFEVLAVAFQRISCFYAGALRCGEAKRLQGTNIDLEKSMIALNDPEKHSNPRMWKVNQKLMDMLAAMPEDSQSFRRFFNILNEKHKSQKPENSQLQNFKTQDS